MRGTNKIILILLLGLALGPCAYAKRSDCEVVMDYASGESYCISNWSSMSYGDEANISGNSGNTQTFDGVENLKKEMADSAKKSRGYELKTN